MNETILFMNNLNNNYINYSGIVDKYCSDTNNSLKYSLLIILIISIIKIYLIKFIPEKYRIWVVDTSNVIILSLSLLQFIMAVVR